MIVRMGRQHANPDDSASAVAGTTGAYFTLGDKLQLFVEHDGQLALQGAARFDDGGTAVGANVLLTETFELISQLYVDSEGSRAAVTAGFILSVPP
jgi:cyanophycinase-like exopeptidase